MLHLAGLHAGDFGDFSRRQRNVSYCVHDDRIEPGVSQAGWRCLRSVVWHFGSFLYPMGDRLYAASDDTANDMLSDGPDSFGTSQPRKTNG
jgi:hypothetical protein